MKTDRWLIAATLSVCLVLLSYLVYEYRKPQPPELELALTVNKVLTPVLGPALPVGEGRVLANDGRIEALRSHLAALEAGGYLRVAGMNNLYSDRVEGIFRLTDMGKRFALKGEMAREVRFPIAHRRIEPAGFLKYDAARRRLMFTFTVSRTLAGDALWPFEPTTFRGCALIKDDEFQGASIVVAVFGGALGVNEWSGVDWVDEQGIRQKGARKGVDVTMNACLSK